MLSKYSDDREHFRHVLDHLIVPSVKKAKLNPVPPVASGSEVIHGEIIKHIETSDLVLCDMSILNPNVFFELGIRTALNKPVCLIKDDITAEIPFDTTIINNHTYSCALSPWTLEKEIDRLTQHIEDSLSKSNGFNSLWKYFSISATAHPTEKSVGFEDKVDYLNAQIEALRKLVEESKLISDVNIGHQVFYATNWPADAKRINQLLTKFLSIARTADPDIQVTGSGIADAIEIRFSKPINEEVRNKIIKASSEMGCNKLLIVS